MFRRERDTRRTAKAVRDHSLTMEAFGRASGWERAHHNTSSSTHAKFAVSKTQPPFYPGRGNVDAGFINRGLGILGIEKPYADDYKAPKKGKQ